MVTGNILNCLWEYHQYSQKDPDSLSNTYCYNTGRYCTNAEVTEMWKDGIVAYLYDEDIWPDRELMTETEAMALRDRIIDEIQGADKMPYPRFVHDHSYEEELEVGFSPLVIRPRLASVLRQTGRTMDSTVGQRSREPHNQCR